MTVVLLFVLIFSGFLFFLRRWRKTGTALLVGACTCMVAVGDGPVPSWLLYRLQRGYSSKGPAQWGERNGIVLLGAGTERAPGEENSEVGNFAYGRLVKADELYRACIRAGKVCKIVASGADPQHHGGSEAEVYALQLVELGVDPADILREDRSTSTWENARNSSRVLEQQHLDFVVMVSSGIHLRRGVLYFRHFGVTAIPVRGDYYEAMLSPIPLGYNFLVADSAIQEYVGIARYNVYNYFGWNEPTIAQP